MVFSLVSSRAADPTARGALDFKSVVEIEHAPSGRQFQRISSTAGPYLHREVVRADPHSSIEIEAMSGMALETGIEVNLLASETTRFVENPVHDGGRVPLPTVRSE